MTTNTTTATVETLTAQVHALQVGSRQITQSVVKQLDSFDEAHDDEPLDFTPFGRVRTGKKIEAFVNCKASDRGAEYFPGTGGSAYQRLKSVPVTYEWVGLHKSTGNLIHVFMYRGYSLPEDKEWDATVRRWMQLPLIVLAGLR